MSVKQIVTVTGPSTSTVSSLASLGPQAAPAPLAIGCIGSSAVTANAFDNSLMEDAALIIETLPTDASAGYADHTVTRIDEADHGATPITAGYDILTYVGDSGSPPRYSSLDNEHASALPLFVNNSTYGLDTKLCNTNTNSGSDNNKQAVCLDATVISWSGGHAVTDVVDWNAEEWLALYNYDTGLWDATDVVRLWENQGNGTIIGVLESGQENNNATNITARLCMYTNPLNSYAPQVVAEAIIEDCLQWLAGNI